MKKLLLFGYLIIATWFAIPSVMIMLEDEPVTLNSSTSDSQWEFLKDYAYLIQYADSIGYKLTAGELYRTMYQQRYYVAHGLSWTYNSKHLIRKGGDLNLFVNGKFVTECSYYKELGEYWESLSPSNKWGGRFGDCPHFERR